jgi:hypothetical protein
LAPRLAFYPVGNCHNNRRNETTNGEQNTNTRIDPSLNPWRIRGNIAGRHDQAIGQIRDDAEGPANGKCLPVKTGRSGRSLADPVFHTAKLMPCSTNRR